MDNKKINWLFLTIVLIHWGIVLWGIFCGGNFSLSLAANLLVSELILVVPAILFYVLHKKGVVNLEGFGFKKIKISTVFMTVLYTAMVMPLTTLANAISMLFVDNTVLSISQDLLGLPYVLGLFMIGIYGPFCEELVFRGIVFKGYRKTGSPIGAIVLSGFLFGLIHMNFNQAGYAFVMGIALAFLMEVSGSIWPPIICHVLFNAQSVTIMYIYDKFLPEMLENTMVSTDELISMISIYAVIATVTTTIAIAIGVWIGQNEKKAIDTRWNWIEEKKRITLPLILGVILSFTYMFLSIV